VATRFKQRFGPPVYDLWGQTEGTPITSYDPSRDAEGRPESCGRALPGCRVRVIDDAGNDLPADAVGEVLLAGPNIFLGYDKNPVATAETLQDGWVHTGDLGKLDNQGFLYIVGRKRDLVIRGGSNIYPAEVEEAIYSHPAVAECAVIGISDEIYGEAVKAFVVTAAGQAVSKDELLGHCRQRIAEYKVPSTVEFIESLPKGPTGKILKRELRDREAQNSPRS
jgi:long-chain acyl-CoA synthetase